MNFSYFPFPLAAAFLLWKKKENFTFHLTQEKKYVIFWLYDNHKNCQPYGFLHRMQLWHKIPFLWKMQRVNNLMMAELYLQFILRLCKYWVQIEKCIFISYVPSPPQTSSNTIILSLFSCHFVIQVWCVCLGRKHQGISKASLNFILSASFYTIPIFREIFLSLSFPSINKFLKSSLLMSYVECSEDGT